MGQHRHSYTGLFIIEQYFLVYAFILSAKNNIAVVNQFPYIFNMSIRDNLRLVKDNLTEDYNLNGIEVKLDVERK